MVRTVQRIRAKRRMINSSIVLANIKRNLQIASCHAMHTSSIVELWTACEAFGLTCIPFCSFLGLASESTHESMIKLLVSSLYYAEDSQSRPVLAKILTRCSEVSWSAVCLVWIRRLSTPKSTYLLMAAAALPCVSGNFNAAFAKEVRSKHCAVGEKSKVRV